MSHGWKVEDLVDLDALRGWKESRNPALRTAHPLSALARLVEIDDEGSEGHSYGIHGPDVLLGRFQAQYAPVDLLFHHCGDHELYRMGAPQAHLSFSEGSWQLQALSPRAQTSLNGQVLQRLNQAHRLADGDEIGLGVVRFRFQSLAESLDTWQATRSRILGTVDEPSLFLKRCGGPCGPFFRLPEDSPVVLGRSFPPRGVLPGTDHWPVADPLTWDLSGLYEYERRYVAFRHARIGLHERRWVIEPLSTRQRTFVNRVAISHRTVLEAGDEIALGTVLMRFHHPHRSVDDSSPRYVPAVVDWGA